MIKIYQGTQHQVNQHLLTLKNELAPVFCLYNHKEFPQGFGGMRMLVQYLKDQFSETEVQRILEADAAIASFIFPEMEKTLSESQKKEYLFYHARLESRLNVPYGLFERMAKLIGNLLESYEFAILIPDLRTIDSESLRVFENYYRSYPDSRRELVLGFPTDIVDVVDENGITWARFQGDVQYFIGGFQQYPQSETILLKNNPDATSARVTWNNYQLVTPEEATYNRISADVPLNSEQIREVIGVMDASYHRYSFRAVMLIGEKLLATQSRIDNVLKSYIHGLIGSAANFYQFSHHANPPFDLYMTHHFEEALRYEDRPAIRMALLYRISFTYAERRSEINIALEWAEQFVREAAALTVSQKQRDYHLSWAYNVRGYLYAHLGRIEEFAKDADNAYKLLDNGIKKMEKEEDTTFNYWLQDYKLSIFNLSIHQVYTGDEVNQYEYSKAWHKKMSDIMKFMPRIMLFDTFHWIDFHRNKFTLREALKSAEEGIQDAKFYKHGQIYVYTFCAADFTYRMGKAAEALELFKKAEEIRPYYNDLFYIYSMQWFIGNCYSRMKLYNEAESTYQAELAKSKTSEYRIILRCKLALVAAHKGEQNKVEVHINAAIEDALEYGEQNLLIKVASTAAYCLYAIGETEQAAAALSKAQELAQAPAEAEKSLNDAYLFEMYLHQLLIESYSEPVFLQALQHLRKALNDIESWWHLPAFKQFVTTFEKSNATRLADAQVIDGLNVFKAAFAERVESMVAEMATLN